jgi:hypothetical protein
MVAALWAVGYSDKNRPRPGKTAFLAYLLSAKVFSLVTLVGIWRSLLQFRTIAMGAMFFVVGHLILLVTNPLFTFGNSGQILVQLYQDWMKAASSGGAELGAKVVRGQNNHGLTTAVLRWLDVEATRVSWDMATAVILASGFGFLWQHYGKKLRLQERWAGWLAIGLITHPLAWHHSFVMAFPLCTFSLQEAIRSGRKWLIFWALFGISCIGIFIPQVIGVDAVKPLEYLANKSWGAVICGVVLILARSAKPPRSRGKLG